MIKRMNATTVPLAFRFAPRNGVLAFLVVMVGVGFSGFVTAATSSSINDQGVFEIRRSGEKMGIETFAVKIHNGIGTVTARSEFTVGGASVIRRADLKLEAEMQPVDYKLVSEQNSIQQKVGVLFKPGSAMIDFNLGKETKTHAVDLPSHFTIIDDNVFSHWTLLLNRFDAKAGDSQKFKVLTPQMGVNGVNDVTLKRMGDEMVTIAGQAQKLQHFHAQTDSGGLDIYSTDAGLIMRITVSETGAEIVRVK